MRIPAGSGGGVEYSSEDGALSPCLVDLIATLGRPRMPRMREVARPAWGRGRLQHMSGSRRRTQAPWDRGRGTASPIGAAGAGHNQQGGGMQDRRLVGIDLGITSVHTVRVLSGDGTIVCRRKAVPTLASLVEVERAALVGAMPGACLEVVVEPTGPSWLPIAVFFGGRGHTVSRVSSAKAHDLRRVLSRHAKSNGIDADTLARLPLVDPTGLHPLVLPDAPRAALDRRVHRLRSRERVGVRCWPRRWHRSLRCAAPPTRLPLDHPVRMRTTQAGISILVHAGPAKTGRRTACEVGNDTRARGRSEVCRSGSWWVRRRPGCACCRRISVAGSPRTLWPGWS